MVVTTGEPHHIHAPFSTRGGMVTSNHHLAAAAGAAILAQGGNAVDAAAATAFAVGVVEPAMSGLGGRGYLVVYAGDGAVSAVVDGHERAPRAARPDMFRAVEAQPHPTYGWGPQVSVVGGANAIGHLAVAVPGVVAALATAHARYGRLPLHRVLEPAIALADDGFVVSVPLAVTIASHRAKLLRFPASAAIFLPDGHTPAPGERLIQRDLARSLRLIAANGPEEFYAGAIARAIAAEMTRAGGLVCRDDLAAFTPRVWMPPLEGSYRGYRILTVPEATGGVTLLQIMNLLEGFDPTAADSLGTRALHRLLEAFRIAFRDRFAVLDDPAFVPVPYAGLASKAFADQRRHQMFDDRANCEVAPADPWRFEPAQRSTVDTHPVSWRQTDVETTHFCALDAHGMTVAMTQSLIDAFGSGVVVPGTGILLNSAMHNFNPIPAQLGSIAPWKRSVHNGVPTIVVRPDGRPALAIGGGGGTKIITGVAQALVHVLDHGWSIQEAVAAPRVHNEGGDSQIDSRVAVEVRGALCRMGHRFEPVTSQFARPAFARINAIAVDTAGARWSGIDPFGDAGAAAELD